MSEPGPTEDYFKGSHGFLNRLLHRCAFSLDRAHRVLVDLEDHLYGDQLQGISIQEPLFVAGLPRSGTTLLLRVLVQGGPFASHTHREAPFVLSPLIWNQYADLFGRSLSPRERAHGDGMTVSDRSPAALEEVLWKFFWPSHYREDHVVPWRDSESPDDFQQFFRRHIRKIKLLRNRENPDALRYISKNNLNLARLQARPAPLNEGRFLVPFRSPLAQAASLLEQHHRFLRIHDDQPFVAEYMKFLGHFEFGKTLRPIRFTGENIDDRNPERLEHWVRYWIHVHREILDCDDDRVHLFSYDAFVRRPVELLNRLVEVLDLSGTTLVDQASAVRAPREHRPEEDVTEKLTNRALDLYGELEHRARSQGLG